MLGWAGEETGLRAGSVWRRPILPFESPPFGLAALERQSSTSMTGRDGQDRSSCKEKTESNSRLQTTRIAVSRHNPQVVPWASQ
jgi:hypothetical protein